jgi:type II secretory pathway pseudopilin PulG
MVQAKSSSFDSRGFSLAETMVAMGILMSVALGVAQLFAASGRANLVARGNTSTTALAEQKMEQLRSMTWGFDDAGQGLPVTDTTTNIAVTPPAQDGTGLNPSPSRALEENTPGFVDYLDDLGTWVGTGADIPSRAYYIRRWSIEPLPTNPNNTIIIQVLVTTVANEAARPAEQARTRVPGDSLLVTVKTRKAS